jgi:hypothetical protein
VSGRVWYRPTPAWEFQVSTSHLTDPEQLEPGNIERTTATASWWVRNAGDFTAVSVGYGVNATPQANRSAVFAEATRHAGDNSLYARLEVLQEETDLLLTDTIPAMPLAAAEKNVVGALTVGGVHEVAEWHGVEAGLGVALGVYAVPDALTAAYGSHPVSFQIYARFRPPAGRMGRMWNMRMSQPMAGHQM